MSRVESPFVEPSVGLYFGNVISAVFSPEAPPLLGAYDNHRKQAVNRPLRATLSPGWNPSDDRPESRSAGPLTIASDQNGAVCIENLPSKGLQDRITVGVTRTSVVPSGPAVTPLTASAEPPCPSSVWARTVNRVPADKGASQSGDYCTGGEGKYR